jgi:hypothetical protein
VKTQVAHGKVLVPAEKPSDWQRLLAQPDKHWKPGRSAWALAHAWQAAGGLPPEIRTALEPQFPGVELLLAVPERQVPLPGGERPSQNDVWALCRTGTGLLSLAVEGKVDEPFGPTVGEWTKGASTGKRERLAFLCRCLGLDDPPPASVRYQLLHRAASAILEAERFTAPHAVMAVHSFDEKDRCFEDFAAFVELLGGRAEIGRLHAVPSGAPSTLHVGWVRGEKRFLGA